MRDTIEYNFKTYEELVLLFERANRAFLKLNQDLLYSEVSERALCGALMIQIYNLILKDGSFYGYHVDVEYNRNKGGLKTICEVTNELGRNRYEITRITCDLILHSRGKNKKQDNLIALEMKKSNANIKNKNSDWTIVNKKDTIFKYIFWERLDSLPIPESCFHFVWCQIA